MLLSNFSIAATVGVCILPCLAGGKLVANNTRIMPAETFGCAAHFFSPEAQLQEVYALHMFR